MMEWLDSLWAWIMSLLASFVALFTVEAHAHASQGSQSPQGSQPCFAQTNPPLMDLLGSVASEPPSKAAEVFEALAAHVPPMLVELSDNAPPNM